MASSRMRIFGSARMARAIGEALPLAAGELHAALADEGVVAVRELRR